MELPLTITDNYILITSDEEIKEGEWCYIPFEHSIKRFGKYFADDWKKIIGHLPLNNAPKLEGVPLLPPLPSGEDDVEKLAEEWYKNASILSNLQADYYSFIEGYNKAKEKYRFTEEDMEKAVCFGKTLERFKDEKSSDLVEFKGFIQSLSQPKMPIGVKCEMEHIDMEHKPQPKIINGVMQGEWIY